MIVFTLLGVAGLQLGQYWAEAEDAKLKQEFEEQEAKRWATKEKGINKDMFGFLSLYKKLKNLNIFVFIQSLTFSLFDI